MKLHTIEIGDLVSHCGIPKTLGVAYEQVDCPSSAFYAVHWIVHPDIDMYGDYGIIDIKWLRPFKPWRGFYKRED